MATGTSEFIDITTADVFLVELWSNFVVVAREANLVYGKLFTRQFEAELKKGQVLRIGNISDLAARQKSANTAITYETVTETEGTLTIDQYYYAAFAIEDIIKEQTKINFVEKYTEKLGYALALQEDDTLAGHVDNFTQTVGTLATALEDDNIIRADQYLNDAKVPVKGRFIVISPAEKGNWLKMDKMSSKDYRADSAVVSGILGDIYGYKVFVSTNVEGDNSAGHDCCMAHPEAVGIVTQMKPKLESQRDIDYLCDKVVASELFGTAEIRDDHGVWMKGL